MTMSTLHHLQALYLSSIQRQYQVYSMLGRQLAGAHLPWLIFSNRSHRRYSLWQVSPFSLLLPRPPPTPKLTARQINSLQTPFGNPPPPTNRCRPPSPNSNRSRNIRLFLGSISFRPRPCPSRRRSDTQQSGYWGHCI